MLKLVIIIIIGWHEGKGVMLKRAELQEITQTLSLAILSVLKFIERLASSNARF